MQMRKNVNKIKIMLEKKIEQTKTFTYSKAYISRIYLFICTTSHLHLVSRFLSREA